MVRLRYFEERLAKLFKRGQPSGFAHPYRGEEAVAVGVCSAPRATSLPTSWAQRHRGRPGTPFGIPGEQVDGSGVVAIRKAVE